MTGRELGRIYFNGFSHSWEAVVVLLWLFLQLLWLLFYHFWRFYVETLVLLLSERASFCQPCPSSSWLTQNCWTSYAEYNCLSVTENCCDLVTARAFDVHEVGVGVLHQALQLVLAFLILWAWVQKVFGERHLVDCCRSVKKKVLEK